MIKKIIKSIISAISFISQKIKFFLIRFWSILKLLGRALAPIFRSIKSAFSRLGQKLSRIPFYNKFKSGIGRILHLIGRFFKNIFSRLAPWEKGAVAILVLIVIICGSILGVQAYNKRTKVIPLPGGEYTEGIVGEPKYINPILAQTNKVDEAVSALVFSGLTRFDQKRQIIPDIAQKWEQSPDGKTYTFYIRKNDYWHDGQPVTAEDVIFTISAITDPDYQGTLGKTWRDVKVEKVDDKTVRFTLNDYVAGFINNTTIGLLPKHILGNISVKNMSLHTFNLNPVGTGPYAFERLDFNSFGGARSVILKRNDNYYLKKPYLDKINFYFYPDQDSLFEAYKSKEISSIESIKSDQASDVRFWRNLNLYRSPLPEYTALFLNTKKPLLDSKDIRKALASLTDKQEILKKVINSEGRIVDGPILPDFFGYNPNIYKYKVDSAYAKSILDNNGYKEDKSGIRKKDGKNLQFSLVTVNSDINTKTAEMIRDQWKKAGIDVKITATDSNTLQRDYIRPRNYDILLFGESLGADSDTFPYWHSSEVTDPGLNLSSYINKEVDRCLEDARKTGDVAVRQQKYTDLQNIIIDDVPAVFLYSSNYIFGASSKIKGVKLGAIISPADRFVNISQWYINYKRQYK